jgi:hypothetical protein
MRLGVLLIATQRGEAGAGLPTMRIAAALESQVLGPLSMVDIARAATTDDGPWTSDGAAKNLRAARRIRW